MSATEKILHLDIYQIAICFSRTEWTEQTYLRNFNSRITNTKKFLARPLSWVFSADEGYSCVTTDKWNNLQLVITTAMLSQSTKASSPHLHESRDILKKHLPLFVSY